MPNYDAPWLPYLGDVVAVRAGDQALTGTTTRCDAALVEVEVAGVDVQIGQSVGAAWRVGTDVHRGPGRVTNVSARGFSVRLEPAPTTRSRREHERLSWSLPMVLTPDQHGSYGAIPRRGRSLDLSNGGVRALIDADAGFAVGEVLRVEIDLGDRVETLLASVVWESGHGAGERVAGLRFQSQVQASSWVALSRANA